MMTLTEMGKRAQAAEQRLSQLSTVKKNRVLKTMANQVRQATPEILKANAIDMQNAEKNGVRKVMLDRLQLDDARVNSMAAGLEQVADLADPIGEVLKGWTTEAGLEISQVRVPLGVIGMIYEARPNVTVDAAGLTFKSGNAVILRGGKEAISSNQALVAALRQALQAEKVAVDSIQLITDTSHETATALMQLTDYLDVLIPRGSAKFIKMVVEKAKVPVIETGAGNCHVYVDEGADLQMATDIVVNAKTQRPSVCNAMEKLVVNQAVAAKLLPMVAKALKPFNVDLRGDERAKAILPEISLATEADWGTEYNDYIMAIKVVDNLDQAIAHINRYNTKHSEAIITNNYAHSERFTKEIDAAVVYVNASTRFTDGVEFGFGAEIGISTQKLHARGPMGLNEITSTKYVVRGNGQVRK
ncbi:gamma-glutamyl phosphate reductase [Pediococcus damnosus LMG 28219]|uniref:glutamate-5-semialdehyde dehydrogenase n=1 Tax=Pediococcus damnosus TaxID=51663 RepID=UPI00061E5660|nr:glutamate-5-semialdehyde dehydrogenase [Pediococcus damnosus]AMV68866.1 Gamma-glutamyl phosphate reductase [Pediococcus damnosus]KJU73600.1 gamma-glutamyl phosphate reductase [Pediococcus damnosus LMG 28219]PIO80653.1 gamma-glutamyl-phosphate reductase [Pediococcus damnosus]GEA93878.1 gamma-glutamyl phosphate reductase [Pediococcus damnosus]